MMIREHTSTDLGSDKVLKVRLPTDVHLRLHSLKILTGKSISNAVAEALSAYFDAIQATRSTRGAPDEGAGSAHPTA